MTVPGFPGSSCAPEGFPKRVATRRKRREPRERADEIPEEERTHVVRTRFALGCGAKRIGVEAALIVTESPTCPGCRDHLRAQAENRKILGEFFGEGVNW